MSGEVWTFEATGPLHELASGARVPARFQYAETSEGGIRVMLDVVTTDHGPVCRSIELASDDDVGVPATALRRVEMRRMLREAPGRVERFVAGREFYGRGEIAITPGDLSVFATESVRASESTVLETRSRGKRIDVDLIGVAKSYRKAHELGQPPTETVAREFNVSRPTASRWIRQCRERGLLGPAKPGAAGEYPR